MLGYCFRPNIDIDIFYRDIIIDIDEKADNVLVVGYCVRPDIDIVFDI